MSMETVIFILETHFHNFWKTASKHLLYAAIVTAKTELKAALIIF